MNKDDIKKALECCETDWCCVCPYYKYEGCETILKKDVLTLITEQEKEIEDLKSENEKLTKVVSSKVYDFIDNVIEIAGAREAWEKQAKIDVLNKVKDIVFDYLGVKNIKEAEALSLLDSTLTYDVVTCGIDEIIKEIENDK